MYSHNTPLFVDKFKNTVCLSCKLCARHPDGQTGDLDQQERRNRVAKIAGSGNNVTLSK
jgi:hypothetical protein